MTHLTHRLGRFFFPISSKLPLLMTLGICTVLTLGVIGSLFVLQPLVPLFYSLSLPSQYLAPKMSLLLLPVLAWCIYLFNTYCIHLLRGHLEVLQQIFSWVTCAVASLFLMAFIRIALIIL